MRYAPILLLLAMFAQSARAETPLAIAYPSTTLIYAEISLAPFGDLDTLQEVFQGMGSQYNLADLSAVLSRRLDLSLTEAELKAMAGGLQRASLGLLDITVGGPKMQLAFEHKDLSAFKRALDQAAERGSDTVPAFEDYDGHRIYTLDFQLDSSAEAGVIGEFNPWRGMMPGFDFVAVIMDNRRLILAPTISAAKDAVDGLLFPEDPADTLQGNRRYVEAMKDFKAPDGLFFFNVQALIHTAERLSGDRGSGGMFDAMMREAMPWGTDAAFWASVTQYEQLKSFAGALWIPAEAGGTQARLEARLTFHNAPGWLNALRVPPMPMPMLDLIPEDAIFAITSNIEDPARLNANLKEFLFSRAREAGKTKFIEEWEKMEADSRRRGLDPDALYAHISGGQAFVVLPTADNVKLTEGRQVGVAGLIAVRSLAAAQEYFYETLLTAPELSELRAADGDLSPVDMIGDVEVHSSASGSLAFAFIKTAGESGVVVIGDRDGVMRLARMRQQGRTLDRRQALTDARGALWPTQNVGLYMNAGGMIEAVGSTLFAISRSWNWGNDDEEPDRDDTEDDADPIKPIATLFRDASIVGGSRSGEAEIVLRFGAGGMPPTTRFGELAEHYRDVARNVEVRNDLLRVRDAAVTHLVLHGAVPADAAALVASSCLTDSAWAEDPFGTDNARHYLLAAQTAEPDIRQAILLAYQPQPGLHGRHLCVLWNRHVVSLTREDLQAALEAAAQGKAIPDRMYAVAEVPLHKKPVPSDDDMGGMVVKEEFDDAKVEVDVIDDQGNETTEKVDGNAVATETERVLDKPKEPAPAGE